MTPYEIAVNNCAKAIYQNACEEKNKLKINASDSSIVLSIAFTKSENVVMTDIKNAISQINFDAS